MQEWLHEQEQAQQPVDIMILVETAWKSDMEYVTAPHPTSEARWFAIHSGSQSSQGGILCLISQRLACGSSLQHSSILQGRLLHVRIPLQTPLDILCIYQYSWNTQKQFGDNTGRKVDALLKQRQSIWNHVRRWVNKIPQRNGWLLLGDFNTPLFQSGLQVGQGIVPIQKVAQTDQEVFQELVKTAGCCALNTWSKSGSAARTSMPAKGHDESGAQIDFVLARGRLADGVAKTCSTFEAPFTPCSGCWHIPLQCAISRPKPPFTPRQGKQPFNMRQVKQMMQQDSLNSHFKELVQSKVEEAETVIDMDHVLQQCWLETYERFRTVNEHRDGEPTSIVPSQHVNVSLVKQLWSARAAIRQSHPLEPGSLRSLFEGWKLAARLQGICRQLRKASKLKRVEVVEAVVQSSDVFKAAKILYPKTPRRKLQLRDSDGNIQSREAESAQFAAFFRQLYAGPPSTTWSLQCSLEFSEEEVRSAIRRFSPSKALPSKSAPSVLWKATIDPCSGQLRTQFDQLLQPGEISLPSSWAIAELALLPKPGKALKTAADVRPIALLHPCAKILAAMVAERLRPWALQYISDIPQFAYVAGRSLQHALERVVAHCVRVRGMLAGQSINIHAKRSQQKPLPLTGGCTLSLDISKAYDKLPRSELYQALTHAKVDADLIAIIMAINSEAKLQIRHGGASQVVATKQGIRQGCGLSPIVWAICSAYVLKAIQSDHVDVQRDNTTYADDFLFAWILQPPKDLEGTYNGVRRILQILHSKGLEISESKTTIVMQLRGAQAEQALQRYLVKGLKDKRIRFRIDGRVLDLKIVTQHVYLGVVITYGKLEAESFQYRARLAKGGFVFDGISGRLAFCPVYFMASTALASMLLLRTGLEFWSLGRQGE